MRRVDDRGVGISHRGSRRSDQAGTEGVVSRNALRITGELRRWAFHRVGSTAEPFAQAREKARAALLGCARPFLRRGTNGSGYRVRSGFHDRQRIGSGRAGSRYEQYKRVHGCFFLETKSTTQRVRMERGPSHPTRSTCGGETPLLAHRPLAAELGAIHRPVSWPCIRAITLRNDGYGVPMVLSGG